MPEDTTPAIEYAESVHRALAQVNLIRNRFQILLNCDPDSLTGEQWQQSLKAADDLIGMLVDTIVKDTEYTLQTHDQIMSLSTKPQQ